MCIKYSLVRSGLEAHGHLRLHGCRIVGLVETCNLYELNAMDIDSIRGGTCSSGRSQSISSCRLVKLRGLLFLVTCFVLSGIICMAVDQFSHLPRFSRHDGEAYTKIRYKESYNHGANRGPHLGQKPRSQHEDTQPNSRKLLNQLDLSFVHDSSGKEVQSFILFDRQHASLTVALDQKQE